ncbi:hypothetical protein GY45DRAFT_1275104 [Cubamyces sp. BRFM 1775]|nr:hypothetical protein GY45DRAFT_1275104 [Cubamyces sp. BRFM 1775]
MSNGRTLALHHLPVELLYDIYTFSLSPCLPLTCKYLHAVFKAAPPTLHAEYLIRCYAESAATSASARTLGLISKVLRYPICTRQVLEAILRNPGCPYIPPPNDPLRRPTILPRHLFRNLAPRDSPGQRPWTEYDEPLPFLGFLYNDPRIPPPASDSHDGYALTRAVYAGFTPLVRFLLEKDASPACRGNLAVTVAIRRKSLPLVRMLIERDGSGSGDDVKTKGSKKRKLSAMEEDESEGTNAKATGGSSKNRGAKRRKLGDRVSVNPEMLKAAVKCNAHDIAEYLMREKGCVPDMQTVLMMGR